MRVSTQLTREIKRRCIARAKIRKRSEKWTLNPPTEASLELHATTGALALAAIVLVAVNLRPAIVSIGPVLPSIIDDFHLSHTKASLLISIPDVLMGALALFTPRLARRFGRDGIILAALLVLFASTTSTRFLDDDIRTPRGHSGRRSRYRHRRRAGGRLHQSAVSDASSAIHGHLCSVSFARQHHICGADRSGRDAGERRVEAGDRPMGRTRYPCHWKLAHGDTRREPGASARGHCSGPQASASEPNGLADRCLFRLHQLPLLRAAVVVRTHVSRGGSAADRSRDSHSPLSPLCSRWPILFSAGSADRMIAAAGWRSARRSAWPALSRSQSLPASMPFAAIACCAFGLGGAFTLGMTLPLDNTDSVHEANVWNAFVLTVAYLIAAAGPSASSAIFATLTATSSHPSCCSRRWRLSCFC